MLEIKDILENSKYHEYECGRDLYSTKKVINIDVNKTMTEGKYEVSATVEDLNGKSYQSTIWINENAPDDKIYVYRCNCDKNVDGMCRHEIALAFSFIKYRKAEILHKEIIPINSDRPTSMDLQDVIRKYAVTKEVISNRGLVNLDLYLTSNGDHSFMVQGKIGIDKKYIIQNLVKLAQDIAAKRKASYSKMFTMYHDRNAFSKEALPRLDFIMELVKAKFSNFEEVIVITNNYRYLQINPFFVERLFNIYMDKKLKIDGKSYHIMENNPKLCLLIKNESDVGISLSMENVRIINGDRHDFVMTEDSIYKCSEDFSRDVIPFIRAMNNMSDKQNRSLYVDRNFYFINKDDYRAFCGNVLLRLQKYIGIVCEEIDLEDYMPTQAKMNAYLDTDMKTVSLKLTATYGSDVYEVFEISKEQREYRDLSRESKAIEIVSKYFEIMMDEENGKHWEITKEDKLFEFLDDGIEELNEVADVYASDTINNFKIIGAPKIGVGIGLDEDFINIDINTSDIDLNEMYEILNAYKLRKKFYRLKSGEFLRIIDGNIALISELQNGIGITKEEFISGKISVEKYFASYIDTSIREYATDDSVRRNSSFKKLIRDINQVSDTDFEVPYELNAKLRNYQKTGYRFLSVLSEFGFGGILADDMGLGKTLQVIALIEAKKKSTLIVCPTSLVYNWESELNRFAPDLSVQILIGDKNRRKDLLETLRDYHVVVTSYDLLKRDIELYKDCKFEYAFIDEAQYIKNATTQVSLAVKKINATHRFALTGTPIENRLSDLYSIFDFVMPGYLKDYQTFKNEFEQPIVLEHNEEALLRFKKMVKPFVLRRKKEEVLKDLPKKMENVIYIKMKKEQRELYDARLNAFRIEIAKKTKKEFKEERLRVLAELTRLRQICCAPDICYENYMGGSGKMDTCIELIADAIEGEHRILVFSQFVQMLSRIRQELNKKNIKSLMLSGRNTKEERRNMVEEFQNEKVPVFLISLKAGGTGLNLTAADIVIHFDPWWNEAVQNQATDRAHRIGQIRTLTVMKLVAKDTIEEKIVHLQEQKTKLADSVITTEGAQSGVLSQEDLLEILDIRNDMKNNS